MQCATLRLLQFIYPSRRKEVMRIGDDNLFEIGCRAYFILSLLRPPVNIIFIESGVECPSIGDFNTFCTRSRVHNTVRVTSYCVIGAGCLVVPLEDDILDEYTVVYGPAAEKRVWSGRGRVQLQSGMCRTLGADGSRLGPRAPAHSMSAGACRTRD